MGIFFSNLLALSEYLDFNGQAMIFLNLNYAFLTTQKTGINNCSAKFGKIKTKGTKRLKTVHYITVSRSRREKALKFEAINSMLRYV